MLCYYLCESSSILVPSLQRDKLILEILAREFCYGCIADKPCCVSRLGSALLLVQPVLFKLFQSGFIILSGRGWQFHLHPRFWEAERDSVSRWSRWSHHMRSCCLESISSNPESRVIEKCLVVKPMGVPPVSFNIQNNPIMEGTS